MSQEQKIQKIKILVRGFFKNSKREPFEMTDGQAKMFLGIVDPKYRWLWISAPTRYGKSDILSMALIYLAVVKHLKIPIVAGTEEKAEKIMQYVLQHLSDHPALYNGLINLDISEVEKLKVSMSKKVLKWVDGGWIYVTSVDSRNIKQEGEGVVGEGGDVVVLEEAGLIKRKEQFSKIVRMPEEDRGWGKLIMSGNCIEGSVFETAFNDPMYEKIRIGLEDAIREGRYTEAYLEDKKKQTTTKDWKRYYLVLFPAANEFTYFKPKKMEMLPRELLYYGAIDPSLGETKQSSKIGITVLGIDKRGQIYEVETMGLQVGPNEAMNTIFNFPYKFVRFGVEDVQFQTYFKNQMDEKSKDLKLYIPFIGIHQRRNKVERIESLEPAIATGQILFRGDNQLWQDMQDYPEVEKLDILDSLEMCFRLVTGGKVDYAFA